VNKVERVDLKENEEDLLKEEGLILKNESVL